MHPEQTVNVEEPDLEASGGTSYALEVSRFCAVVAWAVLAACGDQALPDLDGPTTTWITGPALPVPRLEPGVTAIDQRLIVAGGFDSIGQHVSTRVDVFDTVEGTWTRLPDMPVAWTHIQLAALDTTLFLLGGHDGMRFTARGECYALDTLVDPPAWRTLAPMPAGLERGAAAVVVAPPRIYLLGGASSTDALASNVYYDVQTDSWHELLALPGPRSHGAGMIRSDGAILFAGGLAALATDPRAEVWLLPDAGNQWLTRTAMPTARGGCAAADVAGQLVCAGGETGWAALAVVESYDPNDDRWMVLDPMPEPRAGTRGAAIGDRLYVPGGARRLVFDPTDTLYIWTATSADR